MKATIQAAERQVEGFIGRFDLKNAALIRAVRQALQKRRPSANELVYDNYNFFVIGYCSTERPSDCIVSMAAATNGVGLSFYYGATLPDPHKLLLGSGSQNRFIRLESAETLARPEVEELIAAANWFCVRTNSIQHGSLPAPAMALVVHNDGNPGHVRTNRLTP
jgi:hypothetical protein